MAPEARELPLINVEVSPKTAGREVRILKGAGDKGEGRRVNALLLEHIRYICLLPSAFSLERQGSSSAGQTPRVARRAAANTEASIPAVNLPVLVF